MLNTPVNVASSLFPINKCIKKQLERYLSLTLRNNLLHPFIKNSSELIEISIIRFTAEELEIHNSLNSSGREILQKNNSQRSSQRAK